MNETAEYFVFLALVLIFGFVSLILAVKIHSWRVGPLVDNEPPLDELDQDETRRDK